MIKFTVRLKPITKKNHQQILKNSFTGKLFVAPSKAYQEYEAAAMWLLPRLKEAPIKYPVNVKCLFYMPTKQPCDLTNLLESIDDVMVKAGLLADDNYRIIESHDGSRVLYDKKNPRTEVEITPINGEKLIPAKIPVEWISIEEQMPDIGKKVLCYHRNKKSSDFICENRYLGSGLWYRTGNDEVTHWLPIPEPPKEC